MTVSSGRDAVRSNRLTPASHVSFAAMAVLAWFSLASSATPADEAPRPSVSTGFRFTETTGEDLFTSVCQGCHMPDGNGAAGAGTYPSLARDKNLEAKGYPVTIVVRGQRAMPPVGDLMSDDQVAAVVNYIRTHFGNQYQDAVSAEDVKTARP
jgi:mono/diheme cytochrome c family protein